MKLSLSIYTKSLITLIICILVYSCASPAQDNKDQSISSGERTFSMGFTRWPSEISLQGVQQADDFISEHADLVSIMFIGGIPWQEALEDKPFSQDVQNHLAYKIPEGYELLLSISPLDMGRKALAPYWGESDNQPLSKEWESRRFNSPEVIYAFASFAIQSANALNPDYLAIGIESNALLTHNENIWNDYKEFHREVYKAVKLHHPNLPIFFTIEYNHYTGYTSEAKGTPQIQEVRELMQYSDIVAISSYPHMSYETPWPIQNNHFDFTKQFNKPIGIAETGMSSKPVSIFGLKLRGSEKDQKQYYEALLSTADRDNYLFVATFATTDFDKLVKQLPAGNTREIAKIWQFTGLQKRNGKAKKALSVWDDYLAIPRQR